MIFSTTLILNDIAIADQTSPKLLSRIAETAFETGLFRTLMFFDNCEG